MAGILIHEVSGYSGSAYNLKIPSLTDTANIQEAMMLFHYGIDNYDGSVEPADASVFGNLRDFDNRIAALEETEVVSIEGTTNQIVTSGSVGYVTLSLPDDLIVPDTLFVTDALTVGGSASVDGSVTVNGEVTLNDTVHVVNAVTLDSDLSIGSGSANELSVSGSASFTENVTAGKGVNIFTDSTERDSVITSPIHGTMVYLTSTNTQEVYNGSAWVAIEASGSLQAKLDGIEALALVGL